MISGAKIGRTYRYPSGLEFRVSEVRRFVVVFECGHWCTDNVFRDLVLVIPAGTQLSLF